MAKTVKYTEAFSVSCTEAQLAHLDAAAELGQVSRAEVVRSAIDIHFGLIDGREVTRGQGGQV